MWTWCADITRKWHYHISDVILQCSGSGAKLWENCPQTIEFCPKTRVLPCSVTDMMMPLLNNNSSSPLGAEFPLASWPVVGRSLENQWVPHPQLGSGIRTSRVCFPLKRNKINIVWPLLQIWVWKLSLRIICCFCCSWVSSDVSLFVINSSSADGREKGWLYHCLLPFPQVVKFEGSIFLNNWKHGAFYVYRIVYKYKCWAWRSRLAPRPILAVYEVSTPPPPFHNSDFIDLGILHKSLCSSQL